MATEIVVNELTKRYPNGFEAVKQLSLEIAEAELLVLVGPSGCGKTTALRMIAGLEDITSGDLYIGGKRMNDVPEKDRDIAMVFQNYALYPHMTVAQNIGFSLKLARTPKRELRERVQETARLLAIEQLLDRRPKQLSGGQRQRVAMGRAVIREPQVFLMDEPLSNLDAQLRVHMRGEIESLQKRLGVTTVYVTHDQVEAMTMGDRVAVLRDGVAAAGRLADADLRPSREPLRRRVHGVAADEPRAGDDRAARRRTRRRVRGPDGRRHARARRGARPRALGRPHADRRHPSGGPRGRVERRPVARRRGRARRGARRRASRLLLGRRAWPEGEARGGGRDRGAARGRAADRRIGLGVLRDVRASDAVRIGDRVETTVDTGRLHFFDPETDEAL